MIDIKETIDELEHMSGCNRRCIGNAIKIMKMWQDVKKDSCEFELIRCIEEDYFPSTATQDFIVTIQGSCLRRDNAVQTIECVHGVKEVKPREKDC